MYAALHVQNPLLLSDFSWKLDSPNNISKNSQISNFMTILPAGADLFQADGRADRQTDGHDEASNCFSQFFQPAQKAEERSNDQSNLLNP
jgi:hypothetical protein